MLNYYYIFIELCVGLDQREKCIHKVHLKGNRCFIAYKVVCCPTKSALLHHKWCFNHTYSTLLGEIKQFPMCFMHLSMYCPPPSGISGALQGELTRNPVLPHYGAFDDRSVSTQIFFVVTCFAMSNPALQLGPTVGI